MYVEEICLSTAENIPESDRLDDASEKLLEFGQTSWMRRCRSQFSLSGDQRLSVDMRGFMQKPRSYTIDVGILDPQPKRSFKLCWSYALIFIALCGAVWFALFNHAYNSTPLLVLLVSGAVFSLVTAVYRSHDRLVFYSQAGRAPLIVLFYKSPDKAAFEAFIDSLTHHIKDAKSRFVNTSETLSEELKAHRHLMEGGIISAKRYAIVKQRILSQHKTR
jgi:hypothetical protein